MATSSFTGSQSLIQIGNRASPEVFSTIGKVINFGPFGQANDLIEATHLLSLAKEYVFSLPDGLEFPVVCNYIPTDPQQVAMLAAQAAHVAKNFRYQLPEGSPPLKFSFAAL